MKKPTWEPSAGQLLAFLNANTELVMADLFTFTTVGGTVYRFTSADRLLTVNGNTFSIGPVISRSTTKTTVGIEVSTLNVDLYASPAVLLGATPIVQAFAQGAMDGGRVVVERLFMDVNRVQQGTLPVFGGRIGQVVVDRGHVGMEVLSHTTLLNVMVPSGVFQPSCRNTLYDGFCTVARASVAVAAAASSASDAARSSFTIPLTGTPANPGYFELGVAVGVTGANANVTRTVKAHTGTTTGTITVVNPWPFAVASGDQFTFYPGCDKTRATCIAKYNNLTHFQGEPFIPVPATVT